MPYQIDDIRSDPGHAMTRADRPRAPGARIPIAACIAIAAYLGLHPSAMAATGVTSWLNVRDFGPPPGNIQAAIDATSDTTSKVVYVPGGNYYLTAPLVFPTDTLFPGVRAVRLIGDGPDRTYLHWTALSGGQDFITIRGGRQQIEDLSIIGPGPDPSSSSSSAITIDPSTAIGGVLNLAAIRRCGFQSIPNWGIRILGDVAGPHQVNDAVIEDCDMSSMKCGVYTSGVATAIAMRNMNVTATDTCFRFVNSHDVSLDNSITGGDNPVIIVATDCTGITLNQCDIEEDGDQNPFLSITGINNAQYTVANCVFRRTAPPGTTSRIRLVDASTIHNGVLPFVRSLTVLNSVAYIAGGGKSNPDRAPDDITLTPGSSATLIGGNISGELETGTPFRISGDSTEVFTANFNQRVRIPNLTAAQRDSLKDMAAGDVISNGNRLKHWDGARWREVVGFFPLTAATNAAPAGVAMPMVDSTSRDAIPAAVRPEGSLFYNSTTHRLQHWDGSRFLEEVTTVSGSEKNYVQRTTTITGQTILASAPAGLYQVNVFALTHTVMSNDQTFTLHWQDERPAGQNQQNQAYATKLVRTLGSVLQDTRTIYVSGGNITFDLGSTLTSGSYDLHIRLVALR